MKFPIFTLLIFISVFSSAEAALSRRQLLKSGACLLYTATANVRQLEIALSTDERISRLGLQVLGEGVRRLMGDQAQWSFQSKVWNTIRSERRDHGVILAEYPFVWEGNRFNLSAKLRYGLNLPPTDPRLGIFNDDNLVTLYADSAVDAISFLELQNKIEESIRAGVSDLLSRIPPR